MGDSRRECSVDLKQLQLKLVFLLPPRPGGLDLRAFGTAATGVTREDARLPFMPAGRTLPPHLPAAALRNIRRRHLAVLLSIPLFLQLLRDVGYLQRKAVVGIRPF